MVKKINSNILLLLKKKLFNFDLAIAFGRSEVEVNDRYLQACSGSSKKKLQQKYIEASIMKEKMEQFTEDMINLKKSFLDEILKRCSIFFTETNVKILYDFFISDLSVEDIAKKYNLVVDDVKLAIEEINANLENIRMYPFSK